MGKVEFCCKKRRSRTNEEEPIQRRTDHRDPAGRAGELGEERMREAQRERTDLLRVEKEVWGDGSEGSATVEGAGGGMRAAQARGGGASGGDSNPQRSERKKMVSSSSRRRAVKYAVEEGLGSASQACRALGLSRSSYYALSRKKAESVV